MEKIRREAMRRGLIPADLPVSIPPFHQWLDLVTPTFTWDWPHIQYIIRTLDRFTKREFDRLMIFLPPRHGKSESVTIRYPIWRMIQDPTLRVIVGAYNKQYATKFGRKSRQIGSRTLAISDDRAAVEDWETLAGGGYRSVGVGSGVTGHGADLIIIDDPIKSSEEADSDILRDRVWDWYRDDLYTRCEPKAQIILIMTRWNVDDLAGRLISAQNDDLGDKWEIISLPAIAEEDDPLGRPEGAALCPDRFDEGALKRIEKILGRRSFVSLYQQRPIPKEGNFFQYDWFQTLSEIDDVIEQRIRFWDKASTPNGGDRTAGVRMSKGKSGIYYVEDVVLGQWDAGKRERVMKDTAQRDGPQTRIWIEQEPGSGGKDSALYSIRNLAGFAARAVRSSGDKEIRADPFAAQCEAGNVKLIRGRWNHEYLEELCSFPNGKHDDQVDASSGAFARLSTKLRLFVA